MSDLRAWSLKCLEKLWVMYNSKVGKPLAQVWTDNCQAQYKCRQIFYQIAHMPAQLDWLQSLDHCYAQKGQFKGSWDAAGKVIKDALRKWELTDIRSPDAKSAYENSKKYFTDDTLKPWHKWKDEQDRKVLDKTTWKVTERHFGYVTDSEEE